MVLTESAVAAAIRLDYRMRELEAIAGLLNDFESSVGVSAYQVLQLSLAWHFS